MTVYSECGLLLMLNRFEICFQKDAEWADAPEIDVRTHFRMYVRLTFSQALRRGFKVNVEIYEYSTDMSFFV